MSTFAVTVERVLIYPHPQADKLEIAQVGDYQSIVGKGQFHTGDLVAYIPEQAIVPLKLLKQMGLEGRLAGKNKNRVKAVRLRGILSQGLCHPAQPEWQEGADVTQILGITKWEPPIPAHLSGEVFSAGLDRTLKYDIENFKKFPHILEEGEPVVFTEKLHGTWTCVGLMPKHMAHPEEGRLIVSSKGLAARGLAMKYDAEANKTNLYVRVARHYTMENRISFAFGRVLKDEMDPRPVFVLGEVFGCLAYNTPVRLADGSTERIGRIVNKKLPVEVLSYNPNSGKIEPKLVIGYKRQKCRNSEDWLKLSFKRRGHRGRGSRVVATKNHIFFTENMKEVRAEELKVGSKVFLWSKGRCSYEQEQIMLGGLLGDSSMLDYQIYFNHSEKQRDYLEVKRSCFPGSSESKLYISGFGSRCWRFATRSVHGETEVDLQSLCYSTKKKFVTSDWLNRLGPLGLAVWYMDDGTLVRTNGRNDKCALYTNNFSNKEIATILDYFRGRGLTCYHIKQKSGWSICFSPEASLAFQSIVAPFIHSSMAYKLSEPYRAFATDWNNLQKVATATKAGIIETVVMTIEPGTPYSGPYMDKYDIEVEGNHNFFANNILVHNSGVQDLAYGSKTDKDADIGFRIFDIYVGKPGHGHYLNDDELDAACKRLSIPRVPVLYRGPFTKAVMQEYTDGYETITGNETHIREGIVMRPQIERQHEEIGRVQLKSVSGDYLTRKGDTTEYN